MSTLSTVKKEILGTLYREYGEENVLASCIYGSFAAGYARADSDYDVIVVLKNYLPKIGYKYVKEPLVCSILAIEEQMILEDAKKSGLGEFVAGRFLNIYEPLAGEDLLREIDVEYKKRTLIEILMEFNGKYQPIVGTIRFPIEYFLFEKLRRRALFYPPALYSYSRTYSEPNRKRNLEFTLSGFREAAVEIASENKSVCFNEDRLWIADVKTFSKIGKLEAVVEETRRDITSYATHLYAGRVGLNIILDELKSKIKRQMKLEPLEDLKHTSKYLELPEGSLIVNEKHWRAKIAEYLCISGGYTCKSQNLGSDELHKIVNVARKLVFEKDGVRYEVIVKKFKDPRNIKWAILALVTLMDRRFEFVPLKRLANEYLMNLAFQEAGFNTPKVYLLDLDRLQLITEYIEGENLGSVLQKEERVKVMEQVGEEIGKIHEKGFTLGDAKPDNIICTKRGLFITDLEQAKIGGDRTWDIAEFLNYALSFSFDREKAKVMACSFARGYIKFGDVKILEKIKEPKYNLIFRPIVAPNVSKMIDSGIEEVIGEFKL